MGRAKDEMMRHDAQIQEATGIAVEAGVLRTCEYHTDITMEGGADPQEAYKIGNARFTRGELQARFESRKELTDAIKAAIDEIALDECPLCAKMLAD